MERDDAVAAWLAGIGAVATTAGVLSGSSAIAGAGGFVVGGAVLLYLFGWQAHMGP